MSFFKSNVSYDMVPYENGLDIIKNIKEEKEAHEIRLQKIYKELQKERNNFKDKIKSTPITLSFGCYSCEVLGNKIKYYIEKEVTETINLSEIINVPYENKYIYINGGYGNQYIYKYNIDSTFNLKNRFSVQSYTTSKFLENTEQILNNLYIGELLYFSDINEVYSFNGKNLVEVNTTNMNNIKLETTKPTIKKELVTLEDWRRYNV